MLNGNKQQGDVFTEPFRGTAAEVLNYPPTDPLFFFYWQDIFICLLYFLWRHVSGPDSWDSDTCLKGFSSGLNVT